MKENTLDYVGLTVDASEYRVEGVPVTTTKVAGKSTSSALTTAAGASASITVNNAAIAASDVVIVSIANGTNSQGIPVVARVTPTTGSFTVVVYNLDSTDALNGTLVVSYSVVKV